MLKPKKISKYWEGKIKSNFLNESSKLFIKGKKGIYV